MKQIDFKGASGMIKFFGWKLSEWIRDRFERTIGDLTLWMKPLLKQISLLIARAGSFITSPYSRVLSAKNLIIPEAAMFLKG